MKRIVNILLVMFIQMQAFVYSEDNRTCATVLNFTINKSVTAGFDGSTIAVILEEPLSLYYKLVDRMQMEKAMKELKFQVSDMADKDKIKQFGKMVGAELIITGSVVQFGNSITIATKSIDVETGEIKQTAKVSTTKVSEIPHLADTIVRRLLMTNEEKLRHITKFSKFGNNSTASRSERKEITIDEKKVDEENQKIETKKRGINRSIPSTLNAEEQEYIKLLRSGDMNEIRTVARTIYNNTQNEFLLDEIEALLLREYKMAEESTPCDAMSWCCKVLGASRMFKYENTLQIVSEDAPNRKLKKYASVSLKLLKSK